MRCRTALALVVALSITGTGWAAISKQEDLGRLYEGFYSGLAIDESNAYEVKDVTLTKDIGTFKLSSGVIFLTKPIEGLVTSAVFIGEGSVTIKPTRVMDRKCLDIAAQEHLNRKTGGQLVSKFSEAFLFSLDGTLDELSKKLTVKAASADVSRAAGLLKHRSEVAKSQELPFDLSFIQRQAGLQEGPVYIDFKSADDGWLAYSYSPRDQYEVRLTAREKIGAYWGFRPLIVTHKLSDLDASGNFIADPVKDQKAYIDIKKYVMQITIPDTQHFLVEADVIFTPLVDSLPIVDFDLRNNIAGRRSSDSAKPIHLNKVTDASGKDLPFIHHKNRVLILPPEAIHSGTEYNWHFTLDEETIIQLSSVHYFVLNTYPWFPQYGYLGGQYKMDWTVKAKKPLYATGSGKIVEEKSEGSYNITHLVFDKDVQFPSLIFGQYNKVTDTYVPAAGGTNVALAVFSWPRTTFFDLEGDTPQSFDITVPGGKPKDVLNEAKAIIKFGEELYGPFPYDQLQVAQMSPGLGFGQAPPGFVQLTGEAFMSSAELANFGRGNADFFHEFFSHEIGHQWWGHTIGWASDEDVWLSESYAEYTAGLYVMGLLGQDRFQGKMRQWKDRAREADPHGAIAWANNLSGPSAGRYRTGLIYDKGPYVVHMLRSQVGHDNFVKAMKNLTAKYRYQQIGTDQLRKEFEAVVGYKLDYFFDQWYRGTGIPYFDYTTNVRQSEDGKWLATINISQRDKENFKIVSMPVFFHFGKDKVIVKERPVMKADDVYQVKLPEKPDSITLDDYHTLLADIVAQGASAK
ncbi:MAG TPA: M1 family aminopeptidase [Candidatus Polarisedimenticolia bacterium]|jgi:hypothetical protein